MFAMSWSRPLLQLKTSFYYNGFYCFHFFSFISELWQITQKPKQRLCKHICADNNLPKWTVSRQEISDNRRRYCWERLHVIAQFFMMIVLLLMSCNADLISEHCWHIKPQSGRHFIWHSRQWPLYASKYNKGTGTFNKWIHKVNPDVMDFILMSCFYWILI